MPLMQRISEMSQASESVLEEGYKAKNLPGSPSDSWYLILAGVDPDHQKKGDCIAYTSRSLLTFATITRLHGYALARSF